MFEFKFKAGTDNVSKDAQEALDAAIELVALKHFHESRGLPPNSIQIAIAKPYSPSQGVSTELINSDVFDLVSALVKPEILKNGIGIYVDEKRVFLAQNGKVIEDSLNLVEWLKQAHKLDPQKEAEGKKLVQYAHALLAIYGTRYTDSSLHFEGDKYSFSEKDGQLKVCTQVDGREILNSYGFTSQATPQDIEGLQKLKELMQRLKADNPIAPIPTLKI
jgi:hypothetical protein